MHSRLSEPVRIVLAFLSRCLLEIKGFRALRPGPELACSSQSALIPPELVTGLVRLISRIKAAYDETAPRV